MVKCPQCGAPLENGKCTYCGAQVAPPAPAAAPPAPPAPRPYAPATGYAPGVYPPQGGYPYALQQPGARAYPGYPHPQNPAGQPYPGYPQQPLPPSEKNKWVALVLCFFVGLWGGHYFYVGKVGMGICYVFTIGLFGFGWFIDLIRILAGGFKDKQRRPLK